MWKFFRDEDDDDAGGGSGIVPKVEGNESERAEKWEKFPISKNAERIETGGFTRITGSLSSFFASNPLFSLQIHTQHAPLIAMVKRVGKASGTEG